MPEFKEMAEQFKADLETARNEAKAAKEQAEALKTQLSEKDTEINNLDSSVKSLQTSLAEVKKSLEERPMEFKAAMRQALTGIKGEIEKFIGDKNVKNFAVKFSVTTGFTNQSYGVQQDLQVHGDLYTGNAFIAAFGLRARTGSKLSWIEASTTSTVGYAAELTSHSNTTDCTFVEKQREFAKAATKMQISTEAADWFEMLVDYCQNEGSRRIDAFIDDKIFNGAGVDNTKPREIYGLKTNSTAFAAIGKVKNATIADVIINARLQAQKNGYNTNVAIVSYEGLQMLEAVKDANGNYIYDKARGMMSGISILPSTHVAAAEVLVADTTCAQVYAGNSYELEWMRNGDIDGWDVYYRRAAQVKVPTPEKKGLIYVADYKTAIAALTPSA